MAQPGNDNQKQGVVSGYPDNVHQGVFTGGDNFAPLSMSTPEDGVDDREEGGPNRDQRFNDGFGGWVLTPGIE